MTKKNSLSIIYLYVIMVIIYIPLIITIVYSFNASRLSTSWDGFTLDWYSELFADKYIWEALWNSIILAVLSSGIGSIIGLGGSLWTSKNPNNFFANLIRRFAIMPLMIPEIILAIVFLALFNSLNFTFGMVTLVLAHLSFTIPYNYMLISARLVEQREHIEDAARDLGATDYQILRDITLPFLKPAVLSGIILSFAMSFDDVIISTFVTGATVNTLPVKIFSMIKTGVTPKINALSTILIAVVVVAITLSIVINKKKKIR